MAYTYRNVKTNEVITTSNKIQGKNWEEVKPKKKGVDKKGDAEK